METRAAEETFLYRLASFPVRLWRRWASPPRPPIETDDFYAGAAVLRGAEVLEALAGRYGAATRISTGGQRAVTLYSAIPVLDRGTVAGAVLASQSTYRILVDLYDLRLDVFVLFLASIAAAAALSLLAAATITRPIRRLRDQAQSVLDARGRLAGRFEPSRRRDEVGDLARSLGDLSRDLERRVGLLESFASDVAHELRNPLASIRSAVELALSVEEPVARSRLLESAIEDTRRMERLLAGVREVSLLDAGAAPEAEETLDLREAAGHVVESVRLARPDARVRLSVEGDHASVSMPPGRLAQVIANLVENAVDFSPPDGHVRVAVSRDGGGGAGPAPAVLLTVTDEGPGIPADVIERIFDRFYTWRPGGEAGTHAGLGLAIVKAIVEGRGGSVRAESLPGRGARFEVRLPRPGPGGTGLTAARRLPPFSRLLVVPADAPGQGLRARLLRQAGAHVGLALQVLQLPLQREPVLVAAGVEHALGEGLLHRASRLAPVRAIGKPAALGELGDVRERVVERVGACPEPERPQPRGVDEQRARGEPDQPARGGRVPPPQVVRPARPGGEHLLAREPVHDRRLADPGAAR